MFTLEEKRDLFDDFKDNFSLQYRDIIEEQYRFTVFSSNLDQLEKLNSNGKQNFGITKFFDRTEEERNSNLMRPDVMNKKIQSIPKEKELKLTVSTNADPQIVVQKDEKFKRYPGSPRKNKPSLVG